MRINCQKVFMIFYMGVMVIGQIFTILGISKDDKDLILTGASIMLADNIFYIGKLVADGVCDRVNDGQIETVFAGDCDIEVSDLI